jgi:3-oxoacid CoA-transferase
LIEKIRCGGAGIPAFFTSTGVGTELQKGGFILRRGELTKIQPEKKTQYFNGREYILEECLKADFALIKAWKADTAGNLVFKSSA